MTQLYRESKSHIDGSLIGIFRTSDNAHIPLDEGNTDYAAYLQWVASGNTPDADPLFSLDAIKDRKWEDIKNQRDARKSGCVLVGTHWIHTDDSSRIQWIGIKDTARDLIAAGGKMTDAIPMQGQNLMWKTMSGDFVLVTIQLAFDAVQATKELDAILFASAESKRAALYASTTPETFDTTTGWNKTYDESVA
jgi:hypothetical protein